jgi:hypothetical protein
MTRLPRTLLPCVAVILLLESAADVSATIAIIPPPGDMPPVTIGGNGYVNVNGQLHIIDGLPPATTVDIDAELNGFFNIVRAPDGLGGEILNFNGVLSFDMQGTGSLAGYTRSLSFQTTNQWHDFADTDPNPGVRTFAMDMQALQGQLPPGDPDFDLLRITAGSAFGLPSPGTTTLTQLPGGNWNVDSFFDVFYRIDFIGRPGGPLGGMSGSTNGTVDLQLGEAIVPEASSFAFLGVAGVVGAIGWKCRRRAVCS